MGVTILLITHQMQVVQMICNKVAVMENGQVVEAGSVLDVFGKPQAPVTRRFVQTVVNDQIPESILSLVKEQKEHFRVERLKFIGSSVKRPVISDICHVDGIVVNILGATVQELQENVMCVFILQLIGTEEKILEAEKQIDENGVIMMAMTVAPASGCPSASVTVPFIPEVVTCASAAQNAKTESMRRKNFFINVGFCE